MTRPHTTQLLGIIGIILVAANAFFFLASNSYGNDHMVAAKALWNARVAFAITSIVIGALSFAAAQQPKLVGHILGFVLAAAAVVGGIAAFIAKLPGTLGATLVIIGPLTVLLAFHSMRGSRVAWSFLVAMLTVMAIVTLFGAPKIGNTLHIGLWYAIIMPGVMIVGVVALALVRREYRDSVSHQTASQKSQTAAL